MEQTVEKIWKLEKSKDKNKFYKTVIDLKHDIEDFCGIKINIDKHLSYIEDSLKNNGYKVSKKQFDSIKKALKDTDKKHKDHKKYLASICTDDICNFELMAKHSSDEDEEEEIYIPVQLVFGVTLTLCGIIMMIVPFPVCKPWGERMVASGFVICGNCLSGKLDDDHEKKKKK